MADKLDKWGLPLLGEPPAECASCLQWEITPERGAYLGQCIAGRGETSGTDKCESHDRQCLER